MAFRLSETACIAGHRCVFDMSISVIPFGKQDFGLGEFIPCLLLIVVRAEILQRMGIRRPRLWLRITKLDSDVPAVAENKFLASLKQLRPDPVLTAVNFF
jgi:hypothetical protein